MRVHGPGRRSAGTRFPRGVTLIETMIALSVLLIATIGVVSGLIAASRELRFGQLRQYTMVLTDASVQRLRLQNKLPLYGTAQPLTGGTVDPTTIAVNAYPWTVDPSVPAAGAQLDLGTGAYFHLLPDGTITRTLAAEVAPGTTCDKVPINVYCREVAIAQGAPPNATLTPPAGTLLMTVWVRVIHFTAATKPPTIDFTQYEVIAL